MSVIGSPAQISALQAAAAQQAASKARDREKSQAATKAGERFDDMVELRIAGLETADAVRQLPQNNSEQAQTEHESNHPPPDSRSRVDVTV